MPTPTKPDRNKPQSVFYASVCLKAAEQASSGIDCWKFERKRAFPAGFL